MLLLFMNKAKTLLKIEMLRQGISCQMLQVKLRERGYHYTLSSINSKISRGAFSAVFLIQCMEAMGCKNIDIRKLYNESTDK